MREKIKALIKVVRTLLFLPFMIISVFHFLVREWLFGFDNACHYLSQINRNGLIYILRLRGASIGRNCDVQSGIVFHNCKNFKHLRVGDNCHIGKNCFFDLRGKLTIGNRVVISMQSTFITHIDMTKSKLSQSYPSQSASTTIGDDVYVGAGATVLMGVSLGESAFIAAGALVNKDVANHILAAGVPARRLSDVK